MPERSPWRSIVLFVAGMLTAGAFAVGPVGAHLGDSLRHFFKHADKRYPRTVSFNTEMNVGDAPRTVARFGPFRLIARCEIEEGEELSGKIVIETTRDNAALASVEDDEDDFDVSDNANPELWAEDSQFPVGGPARYMDGGAFGRAMAPNGDVYTGQSSILTNGPTAHCRLAGHVSRSA